MFVEKARAGGNNGSVHNPTNVSLKKIPDQNDASNRPSPHVPTLPAPAEQTVEQLPAATPLKQRVSTGPATTSELR